MKTLICISAITLSLFICESLVSTCSAQNVGINNSGAAPNPKAMLDVSSNTKGMLIPRMKTGERNAISSPLPPTFVGMKRTP